MSRSTPPLCAAPCATLRHRTLVDIDPRDPPRRGVGRRDAGRNFAGNTAEGDDWLLLDVRPSLGRNDGRVGREDHPAQQRGSRPRWHRDSPPSGRADRDGAQSCQGWCEVVDACRSLAKFELRASRLWRRAPPASASPSRWTPTGSFRFRARNHDGVEARVEVKALPRPDRRRNRPDAPRRERQRRSRHACARTPRAAGRSPPHHGVRREAPWPKTPISLRGRAPRSTAWSRELTRLPPPTTPRRSRPPREALTRRAPDLRRTPHGPLDPRRAPGEVLGRRPLRGRRRRTRRTRQALTKGDAPCQRSPSSLTPNLCPEGTSAEVPMAPTSPARCLRTASRSSTPANSPAPARPATFTSARGWRR